MGSKHANEMVLAGGGAYWHPNGFFVAEMIQEDTAPKLLEALIKVNEFWE